MVHLRQAINTALRSATGYHLTKSDPSEVKPKNQPGQGPPAKQIARMGFRVHRLGSHTLVALRASQRDVVIDPVDESTWVLQDGAASRRDVIQIGGDTLRTHLLVDQGAARSDMAAVQRRVGEYLAQEQIAWALRKLKINCVLDVGANVGQYGSRLRKHGYRGRIVSFEPLPSLAEQLRTRAGDDPDWLVYECGLGEKDETAEINAVPGTMSSMLPTSEFGRSWSPKLNDVHTETISISRLDSVYDEATAGIPSLRTYLKLDTQGYDLQAFRGAGDRVSDILALQSEVACVPIYEGMSRLPDMLSAYEGAGFEIAGMYPVTFHKRTLRVIEFDMLMVRPDPATSG